MKRITLLALLITAPAFGQDAKKGQALYQSSTCHSCHGDSGDGKGDVALRSKPALNPLPASFRGGFKRGGDRKSIIKSIENGISGTAMIGYKGILTDQQIRDIAAYIETFRRNKAGDS